MSETQTKHRAIAGPSSEDRDAWLAERRNGITATEVRDAAKGTNTARRQIIKFKVTGEWADLTGNQYVDWGHEREPIIADWIRRRFGIEPSSLLYKHPENLRYLATPDGYSVEELTDEVLVAEVKTSKHDLCPFDFPAGTNVPTLTPSIAREFLALGQGADTTRKGAPFLHFWSTGYYDQMQWQMYVMGARRTLFAYEQHDNDWPNPKPLGEPVAVWVLRDEPRIAELKAIADDMLEEADKARISTLPTGMGNLPEDIVDDVHAVLEYRNAESVAEAGKKAAWERVQATLKGKPGGSWDSPEAKVSWSPTSKSTVATQRDYESEAKPAELKRIHQAKAAVERTKASLEAKKALVTKASEAAAKAQEKLDALLEPYTDVKVAEKENSRPLTITAKQEASK